MAPGQLVQHIQLRLRTHPSQRHWHWSTITQASFRGYSEWIRIISWPKNNGLHGIDIVQVQDPTGRRAPSVRDPHWSNISRAQV